MNNHCDCDQKPFPDHPDCGDMPAIPGSPAVATLAELQARYGLAAKPTTLPDPNRANTAAQLCRHGRIKLKKPATCLLEEDMSPRAFFDQLVRHDCLADARRVLAQAIPKRRALWWGCLCALDTYRNGMSPMVSETLDAVVRFVHQPNEENRRITLPLGKRVGINTLAGCLALGTFFSGGSVSRPGLPEVLPRPFVTGRLAGVAVYLASVIHDPEHYKTHLRGYLALGREIASGKNLWNEPRLVEPTRIDSARGGQHLPEPHAGAGGKREVPDCTTTSRPELSV